MPILLTYFLFFLKLYIVLLFAFLTSLTFIFWFHYLFLHFGKYKLGSSTIGKIGKTAFTAEFVTVGNACFVFDTSVKKM